MSKLDALRSWLAQSSLVVASCRQDGNLEDVGSVQYYML